MKIFTRLISIFLAVAILLVTCSCDTSSPNVEFKDPDEQSGGLLEENVIKEDITGEDVITEQILYEQLMREVYLYELILVEEKVTEELLKEEKIEEVILCKTIYIPQDHIEDFAEHSQTSELFGEDVDIEPLLTKIAIGTGIILTLTILSVAGISGPVGSIIAAAAPAAIEGAVIGAGVGTMVGGLTGAADGIDETGRTSAVIGFSLAVVGLIIATVSVIAAAPSGGSSGATAAFGVKLFLAGVSLLGTVQAGYNAIKTFQTTEEPQVDWDNIDWNKVGESTVKQSIEGAANGYMWGSIIGAVSGGAEGYDEYKRVEEFQKFNAPYSKYADRIKRTPNDPQRGSWTGKRGESDFVLKEPLKLSDGTTIDRITYKNGIPDFSKTAKAQVKISITDQRYGENGNFAKSDQALAEYWTSIKHNGKTWSARDVSTYRTENNLTWHEMNNMDTMQLVPTEVNATWGHVGGVGEYNAMLGQQGGADFD